MPGVLPLPTSVISHHGAMLTEAMGQWRKLGRCPPVLLVTGPSGVGKRSLLHYVSQWLLCERAGWAKPSTPSEEESNSLGLFGECGPTPKESQDPRIETKPCGECPACLRALNGSWVDFQEILPETDEESGKTGSLKIDQFRRMKAQQGFGAHEGGFKIHLIVNAERMTPQAANSLLKLLEEPPANWVFLLTASDASLLLPTLVSRCQRLRLRPFTAEVLRTLLLDAGVPADRGAICAELAQGSWGKALALAENETWEKRGAFFRFLESPSKELGGLVDWAAAEPRNFDLLVDQMEHLTADLIRSTLEGPSHRWKNADGQKALASHSAVAKLRLGGSEGARGFWLERSERFALARQEAATPLNRKILVQDLLLPWLTLDGANR